MAETLYDLTGTKGTVICFHGKNMWGDVRGWKNGEQAAFLLGLKEAGLSYVVPPSAQGKWNEQESARNPDIMSVDKVAKDLGAKPPYYLVGVSNGGGFATKYAIYGAFKPNAVQYSISGGTGPLLRDAKYVFPSIFCYSQKDPSIRYSRLRRVMDALIARGIPVAENDLTAMVGKEHKFINTAPYTSAQFLLYP